MKANILLQRWEHWTDSSHLCTSRHLSDDPSLTAITFVFQEPVSRNHLCTSRHQSDSNHLCTSRHLSDDTNLTAITCGLQDTSLTGITCVLQDTSLTGIISVLQDTSLTAITRVLRDTCLTTPVWQQSPVYFKTPAGRLYSGSLTCIFCGLQSVLIADMPHVLKQTLHLLYQSW